MMGLFVVKLISTLALFDYTPVQNQPPSEEILAYSRSSAGTAVEAAAGTA
jgi:hypothetical protein